jgi:hypothetical protein
MVKRKIPSPSPDSNPPDHPAVAQRYTAEIPRLRLYISEFPIYEGNKKSVSPIDLLSVTVGVLKEAIGVLLLK